MLYQSWLSNIQNSSVSNPFFGDVSNVLRELKQRLGVRWVCAQGQLGSWEFGGDAGHWETEPGHFPKAEEPRW